VKPESGPSNAVGPIRDLASRGQYYLSTQQVTTELHISLTAARSALRWLKRKGLIASPHRGFHVIVPPEYQRLGCLPAEQFIPQLMEHLEVRIAVSLTHPA